MRARVVAGKAWPIFAWCSLLARAWWGRSREDAPTLGAQEFGTGQIRRGSQKGGIGIVAISHQHGTQPSRQVGQTLAQLDGVHFPGGLPTVALTQPR